MGGLRIALVSFYLPPPAKAGDGEGGSFVGSSQEHAAAIGLGVVDLNHARKKDYIRRLDGFERSFARHH